MSEQYLYHAPEVMHALRLVLTSPQYAVISVAETQACAGSMSQNGKGLRIRLKDQEVRIMIRTLILSITCVSILLHTHVCADPRCPHRLDSPVLVQLTLQHVPSHQRALTTAVVTLSYNLFSQRSKPADEGPEPADSWHKPHRRQSGPGRARSGPPRLQDGSDRSHAWSCSKSRRD